MMPSPRRKRLLDRADSHGKNNVRKAYTGSETEYISLHHVRLVMVISRDWEVKW